MRTKKAELQPDKRQKIGQLHLPYAMDEMIEEAKQGLRREFPKHGTRVQYTVDWLEVRRKTLELYKQIYGRKGVAGMVYFDPDLVRVETAECKAG